MGKTQLEWNPGSIRDYSSNELSRLFKTIEQQD